MLRVKNLCCNIFVVFLKCTLEKGLGGFQDVLLLLAKNLPTELQVCPHPQTHRVGVLWGQTPGGLAVSQDKILLLYINIVV